MSATPLSIRTPTLDELPIISALLRETWHATYDRIIGAGKVELLSSQWHSVARLTQERGDRRCHSLVAILAGIVAFASTRKNDDGSTQLARFYVRPNWHGQGIGKKLLAAILADLPAGTTVKLDVLEDNIEAVAFYTGEGFLAAGRTADCFHDNTMIAELAMERRLARH